MIPKKHESHEPIRLVPGDAEVFWSKDSKNFVSLLIAIEWLDNGNNLAFTTWLNSSTEEGTSIERYNAIMTRGLWEDKLSNIILKGRKAER